MLRNRCRWNGGSNRFPRDSRSPWCPVFSESTLLTQVPPHRSLINKVSTETCGWWSVRAEQTGSENLRG